MYKSVLSVVLLSTSVLAALPSSQSFQRSVLFEPNRGQAPSQVQWIGRNQDYLLAVTQNGVSLVWSERTGKTVRANRRPSSSMKTRGVQMRLEGAQAWNNMIGQEATGGVSNYLVGNNPKNWHRDIPQYGRLRITEVYPGIDLVFYGRGSDLEYDFIVSPGADPEQIRLSFDGAQGVNVEKTTGDLLLTFPDGQQLRHIRPRIYQQVGERNVEVAGGYELLNHTRVAFRLAPYDKRSTLVIDPTITFNTNLQGNKKDTVAGIAADSSGNSYITGTTVSTDFPQLGGMTSVKSCVQGGLICPERAYITKLSPTGSIVFSTFIGGSGEDDPGAIAVDSSGIYVTGGTSSEDFATDARFETAGDSDAFVAKYGLAGDAMSFCMKIGGNGGDSGLSIALDGAHSAYVAGFTLTSNFPTSEYFSEVLHSFQSSSPGNGTGFVLKLDTNGSPIYSTYLGGSTIGFAQGVAVDGSGSAYVTGFTSALDFPVIGGHSYGHPASTGQKGQTAYLTKLSPDGSSAVYSLYLGGTTEPVGPFPFDSGNAVAVNSNGNAYVVGSTCSADFPTTKGAFQRTNPGCSAFISAFSTGGQLLASTFLNGTNGGSSASGVAINRLGVVYVAGNTSSTNFPRAPAFTLNPSTAGFLTVLSPTLGSVLSSTMLGAQLNGVVVQQTTPRLPILTLLTPTTVYTTGIVNVSSNNVLTPPNQNVFVTKLNDPPVLLQVF